LIPTYLGFADFGMSMASTKFGSEAYAEGDPEKEARIIRTAAAIALASSLPVAALLMIFAGTITGLFNVPEHLAANATAALRIAAVGMVINFLCGIFNTPQLARLRMDLNTLITAIPRILGQIATPIVIYLGYGITGAMAALLAASVLSLLAHSMASKTFLPELFAYGIDVKYVRPMLSFGVGLVFAGFAVLLLLNAEKGIVGSLLSVKELAYYSVAFTFASVTTLLASSLVQSLIPAFTQCLKRDEIEQAKMLFNRAAVMMLCGIVPMCSFLILISPEFFELWAGREFALESTTPFLILIIGVSFYVLGYVPNAVIVSVGRTDTLARIYWIELVPFLLIAIFLTSSMGIRGAAVAWSVRVSIDAVLIFTFARKVTSVRFSLFRRGFFAPIIIYFFFSLALAVSWIYALDVTTKLIIFGINFVAYILVCWFYILDHDERSWLRGYLKLRIV
jgi:O-antigen/teichoic acid export membrane protein